jgi:hypothetical protein
MPFWFGAGRTGNEYERPSPRLPAGGRIPRSRCPALALAQGLHILCPRAGGVDRLAGEKDFCRAGLRPPVNIAQLHHGEKPPISSSLGASTLTSSSPPRT